MSTTTEKHTPKLHDRPPEHWDHDGEHTVTRYRENGKFPQSMRMQQHVGNGTIDDVAVNISQDIGGWGVTVSCKDPKTGEAINLRLELGDAIQQAVALAVNELVALRED